MEFTPAQENLRTCAYNPSHRITHSKYTGHILKCREIFTGNNYRVYCSHNGGHMVLLTNFEFLLLLTNFNLETDKKFSF